MNVARAAPLLSTTTHTQGLARPRTASTQPSKFRGATRRLRIVAPSGGRYLSDESHTSPIEQ